MNFSRVLPYFCRGKVVHGFGRGSKELGIPTANLAKEVVEHIPEDIPTGIYYGWASVDGGEVHKMVMSLGWNPFYKDKTKSMEPHILHHFKEDFYGSTLSVCIVGYIRPEMSYNSVDELIAAIHSDMEVAKQELDKPENRMYRDDNFFQEKTSSSL
ncbi:RFK [Branchiostoma lanceolatum]|uniref:Riboflavin kinase n=1 Tax=Branchiostoma lanceolatum TaxID=7740 RepID=A0A8K0EFV6_BRALA|nr:RFK [Branchiostoma lanceolatum]